jgi:DNA polymerase-3 subunit gamma/tau
MGQALYRKYRPLSLDQVAGQEHVTTTLKNALAANSLSHAYLFTGPRGVGKTSIARILAHEINKLPYTADTNHIDIIEIDAASNRRIDEIRDLREKVYIAPAEAKYKVYIIDEVHMLTKEAFNALLKTLEEPPEHVIFILATTDAHKLPETIISRTQRYNFKPIKQADMVKQLTDIAKQEAIDIDKPALELLAEHGDGSLRDSEGLLDQARNRVGKITEQVVSDLLGLPPAEAINDLLKDVGGNVNASEVISKLSQLYIQGYQPVVIAKQLAQSVRSDFIKQPNSSRNSQSMLELLADLIEVPVSHDPERYLEIVLLRKLNQFSEPERSESKNLDSQPLPLKPQLSKVEARSLVEAVETKPKKVTMEPIEAMNSLEPIVVNNSQSDDELWEQLLNALKKKYNTLYGIVRMASPNFKSDNELDITFAFDFHKKRIAEATNSKIISDLIKQLSGKTWNIQCYLDKAVKPYSAQPKVPKESVSNNSAVSAVSNIFSGAELLES